MSAEAWAAISVTVAVVGIFATLVARRPAKSAVEQWANARGLDLAPTRPPAVEPSLGIEL